MTTLIGTYFIYRQVPVPEWLYGILFGTGPAWGYSRHREKQEKIVSKERVRLAKIPASPDWHDDESDPYYE